MLCVLALVAGACGEDDEGEETSVGSTTTVSTEEEASPEAEAQLLEIAAVDYGFQGMPDELSEGVIELSFDNQGKVEHEFALVEIGDTSLEQFLQDFPPVLEGGPFPDYAENVALAAFASPGQTSDVTFTVAEGTYALFCTLEGDASQVADTTGTSAEGEPTEETEEPTGAPHYEVGMAQVVEIGPSESGAALVLPEADGSITSVDYGFEIDVDDGDQLITYVNEGPEQVHFASISVFPEGTDEAAAEAAFLTLLEAEEQGPPPEGVPVPEDVGFSGVFSTGLGSNFEMMEPFESGRTYVVVCFISDRAGGPPHAIANEMYQVFTVE